MTFYEGIKIDLQERRLIQLRGSRWSARFLLPVIIALAVMAGSRAIYFNSMRIDSPAAYHLLALVSGVVQFVSIVLAAAIIYPVTFFKGAGPGERIVASSINPGLWVVIESYSLGAAFSFWESLYFGLNIGAIIFIWKFSLMGICEMICRGVLKRRGSRLTVITPLPLLPLALLAVTLGVLSRDNGAYYFNLLLDGYLGLFRP